MSYLAWSIVRLHDFLFLLDRFHFVSAVHEGPIPEELGRLHKLEKLVLYGNRFNGKGSVPANVKTGLKTIRLHFPPPGRPQLQ